MRAGPDDPPELGNRGALCDGHHGPRQARWRAVWEAQTNTSLLHRRFGDMVEHLYRNHTFPDGAVLSTGTGLVPDITFDLKPGDVVEVAIDGIGTLVNDVRPATAEHFGWLTPDPVRAPRA